MSSADADGQPVRTPDQAHALVADLLVLTDDAVRVRAELTAAARDRPPAPIADVKALEARLSELLDEVVGLGVQLKGWAPLLVDIPVEVDGRQVLFCWLEGDRRLSWYHELDHGFAGRRPLSDLG
ncbi:DUF2203 domain-containing protein [Rhabdothermincola salaria]|uniref:DUF2203 domain-containing protein n=1 Tax=Rhabdothermincola salaria TaxID=2903142 RepID=UPI001E5360A4|nr:DUF2203 domain-containing protein [Rhabdothermincola salaria]MCD9622495.1 DUF2203 domain-containing protein [Rhabdothermincola salaria]